MMSLQAFAARCASYIKNGTPFIAYRHDRGYGLLKTGELPAIVYTIQVQNCSPEKFLDIAQYDAYVARVRQSGRPYKGWSKATTLKAMRTTVSGFRKAIQKMRKDPCTRGSLCVVECDGTSYAAEGDVGDLIEEALG